MSRITKLKAILYSTIAIAVKGKAKWVQNMSRKEKQNS